MLTYESKWDIKLEQISDFMMSYCELSEDIIFRYIPMQKRIWYVEQSMKMGIETAKAFQGKSIEDILSQNHVEVFISKECGQGYIHSQIQFDKQVKRIDLYEDVLKEIQTAMLEGKYEITMEELLSLHLAHEFYHFLEYTQGCMTYERLEVLKYRVFGCIPRSSTVHRTSEISAHIFAKIVCGFPMHPKILDYILMEFREKNGHFLINKLKYVNEQLNREVS